MEHEDVPVMLANGDMKEGMRKRLKYSSSPR